MPIQALRLRQKSMLNRSKIFPSTPEVPVVFSNAAAPGTGGLFIFIAPRRSKVTKVDFVSDVDGAGSSKVYIRKHNAAVAGAANAAVTTGIVDLISGGIAADSTVRIPTHPTLVTTAGYTTMATGDKLALIPPANWIGCVVVWIAMLD